jgi:hypothetical protein
MWKEMEGVDGMDGGRWMDKWQGMEMDGGGMVGGWRGMRALAAAGMGLRLWM